MLPVVFSPSSLSLRMKYSHLFFDLDHTLWDFEANSRLTLQELFLQLDLPAKGIKDFDSFHQKYLYHNDRLWERYRKGFVKQDELRWKRMWLTLLDFKIGDEKLAREMARLFLAGLPTRNLLFPGTLELLDYLRSKNYQLHLITNGFEDVQHSKLKYSGLSPYFGEVITSEGSNSLKPNKEIFDFAFRKTGAAPEKSIMIGDSIEADMEGAKNAGIDHIFVNHTAVKTDFRATHTVYSLPELHTIF